MKIIVWGLKRGEGGGKGAGSMNLYTPTKNIIDQASIEYWIFLYEMHVLHNFKNLFVNQRVNKKLKVHYLVFAIYCVYLCRK